MYSLALNYLYFIIDLCCHVMQFYCMLLDNFILSASALILFILTCLAFLLVECMGYF